MAFLDSLGSFFGGTPSQTQQLPRFNEQQQAALQQLLGQGLQGVSGTGIEDKARKGFAEQTVPTLAERFTALGGSGTRLGSGGFGQALGSGAAQLESDLAAQGQNRALQLLSLGLTPQFENIYEPSRPSGLSQLLMGLAPGLGQAAGSYFGGQNQLSSLLPVLKALLGSNQGAGQGGNFSGNPLLSGAQQGISNVLGGL